VQRFLPTIVSIPIHRITTSARYVSGMAPVQESDVGIGKLWLAYLGGWDDDIARTEHGKLLQA